jgi:RNA polymerase sigma factor (sigma-70 family)
MTAQIAEFTRLRPLLFSVAYRMLSAASDVDDVLQEAWLRYAAASGVRAPKPYLVQVVTRLCLDLLDSARVRRERYVGPWLPEPVLTGVGAGVGAVTAVASAPAAVEPELVVERREQLSLGAVALLERLSPAERAVLVLREGLDYSHQEIAEAVGVSVEASRQLLSRARQRVAGGPTRQDADPAEHQRLLTAMLAAFGGGDTASLVDLLRADVRVISDGGGEAKAALREVTGRDKAVRLISALWPLFPAGARLESAEVNGVPSLVALVEDRLQFVITLEVRDGRIDRVLLVISPSKLRYLAGQLGIRTAAPEDILRPGQRRDSRPPAGFRSGGGTPAG